ncbi:hypothetical protein Vretimale_11371 [Volvox reticuliferus]|uniref:Uncharacterized protein n=1 Tax=Volvox reticuliferus TaxID=1737510 RepID=A0A8J4CLB2_9CHLO|nr:hypothetical protein Vretifemale_12110 [Volvox reticuliferus]GIM07151.1 hypothetical protein Vretimale_11371 [Volvox reticuliferus]
MLLPKAIFTRNISRNNTTHSPHPGSDPNLREYQHPRDMHLPSISTRHGSAASLRLSSSHRLIRAAVPRGEQDTLPETQNTSTLASTLQAVGPPMPITAPAPDPRPLFAATVPDSPESASASTPASATAPAERNGELLARRKQRVTTEIVEAARTARVAATPEEIRAGLETLESLVPGFTPNLDTLKASEWARLAADARAVASKIILLKSHYPRLDLARVLVAQPKLLLQSPEQLDRSARQVRSLLSRAKDLERLLAAEPALMEPRALVSVLITVTKWYYLEKDPVEVLEADPDLVRRAQDYDVPFEPVYMDEQGNWTAPLLNYKEKRTEWQKYIDQTFYKQP